MNSLLGWLDSAHRRAQQWHQHTVTADTSAPGCNTHAAATAPLTRDHHVQHVQLSLHVTADTLWHLPHTTMTLTRKFDRQPDKVLLKPLTPCYLQDIPKHRISWIHTRVQVKYSTLNTNTKLELEQFHAADRSYLISWRSYVAVTCRSYQT